MEIDQRLKDKEWRLSNLYKIVDKQKNLVVFRRNYAQRRYSAEAWYRNINLKGRQLGFTTDACIDGLDDCIFTRNFTMVIIAHEKDSVTKIFKKVKTAWLHFPEKLKIFLGIVANTDNANELSFNNGSSIRVALSSRSDTVNRLHVSEFGKICKKYPLKAEEIITGAIPSVPEDGRIDIESTAEGEYGQFHDMFWEAMNRGKPSAKKQFKAHFSSWMDNPEYRLKGNYDIPEELLAYGKDKGMDIEQINWYFIEQQTQKKKMKQEYPTTPEEAFEGSGNKLFDMDIVEKMMKEVVEPRKVREWELYEEYKQGHRYVMGCDVAEGVGQDSSTIVIWDFTPIKPKVVATFSHNRLQPDVFAYEIRNGGEKYGNALAMVERNNHGHATLVKLKEIYHNIYKEVREDKLTKQRTEKLGWLTSSVSKPKMMFDIATAVDDELVDIPSMRLLRDMKSYDEEDLSKTTFDEEQTKHWDLTIAAAIGF